MDESKANLLREHLHYEHDMLDGAFAAMAREGFEKEEWFIRNAVICEFWVHARNLIEFYGKTEGASASASDFTTELLRPEFRLKKGAPAVQNAGAEFTTLINEQVCHLKYERVSSPDEKLGGYDVERVKDAIDRALRKFESLLTPEAQKIWRKREPRNLRLSGPPSPSSASSSASSAERATLPATGPTGPTGSAGPWRPDR